MQGKRTRAPGTVRRICQHCGAEFFVHGVYPGSNDGKYCCHAHYALAKTRPWLERFWASVDKTSSPHGCWLWTPKGENRGYGTFTSPQITPRTQMAHRLAWKVLRGPIPEGGMVLHRCEANYAPGDVTYRRCCNPEHLYLGDHAANMADRVRSGRGSQGARHNTVTHPELVPRGQRHGCARLTDADVMTMRARYAAGESAAALSEAFGVHLRTAFRVVRRERWQHLPPS